MTSSRERQERATAPPATHIKVGLAKHQQKTRAIRRCCKATASPKVTSIKRPLQYMYELNKVTAFVCFEQARSHRHPPQVPGAQPWEVLPPPSLWRYQACPHLRCQSCSHRLGALYRPCPAVAHTRSDAGHLQCTRSGTMTLHHTCALRMLCRVASAYRLQGFWVHTCCRWLLLAPEGAAARKVLSSASSF